MYFANILKIYAKIHMCTYMYIRIIYMHYIILYLYKKFYFIKLMSDKFLYLL